MEREFSRMEKKIMAWLITMFDVVVIALGVITMLYVMILIFNLAIDIFTGINVEAVLQGIVLVLIFLEIFEIIGMYLKYHHVSMKNIAELGVLALVKELLITLDFNEIGWETLLAISALILALGVIYTLEMRRINRHDEFLLEHEKPPEKESEP